MSDNSGAGHPQPKWVSGEDYERYVGRWSRVVAPHFLDWLKVLPASDWLDVGCGTGVLSHSILQVHAPRRVVGIDRSLEFITHTRERIRDDRAFFLVADAQALPYETASFDAAALSLVLNFLPHPGQAVREMMRVVKRRGVVGAYVWDYAGKMQFLRHFWNAAVALDPTVVEMDQGRRFPLCQPKPLADVFRNAGLDHVEVRAIEIATDFADFDDYWMPFLGGQGPAPGYLMGLDEERRAALRERIRAGLPFAIDGSIPLVARVWAVRGVRSYTAAALSKSGMVRQRERAGRPRPYENYTIFTKRPMVALIF